MKAMGAGASHCFHCVLACGKGAGMRELKYRIGSQHDGKSVEQYLMKEQGLSRRLLVALKHRPDGMMLNGVHIRTVDKLSAGDVLTVRMEDDNTLAPNPDLPARFVYEDDDVAVLYKPPFMPTHPSWKHYRDTLGNYFTAHCPDCCFRALNRLDGNTSGLVAVAKNPYAASRTVTEKQYLAVVCGCPPQSGQMIAPIRRCVDSIQKREVGEGGKYAETSYQTLRRCGAYTLVRVQLRTGRTHQIRVHFSSIGYPLAGDELYGGSMKDINRHALHCAQLSFQHPVTGERITLDSPLPDDMRRLLDNMACGE